MKYRPEKVNLLQTKIRLLEVVVKQGQISPDREKVKSVKNSWTPPPKPLHI